MAEDTEPTYIVEADVYEDLKGGRGKKIVAHKGDVLPWGHAHVLGLVRKTPPKAEEKPKAK